MTEPAAVPRPTPVWRAARAVFGLAGLAFLVAAFVHALRRPEGSVFPSWGSMIAAAGLAVAAQVFGARAWTALLKRPDADPGLARGFFVAQLGKYIPGVVWQAVALVEGARRAGVAASRASAAFPTFALAQVAAGGTVAAGFSFAASNHAIGVRVVSLAGLAAVLLLDRRWMARGVSLVARRIGREAAGDAIPSQNAITQSYAWSLASMLCAGVAFSALISSLEPGVSVTLAVTSFAIAWTAGFVAIPFPSGVGVREAVLLGTLGPVAAAPIIASAVAQRLVTMVAEVAMVAGVTLRRRGGPER